MANNKLRDLQDKYGDDPNLWRMAGGVSLLGAEFANYQAELSNSEMAVESYQKRQDEIHARADISIANIIEQGKGVAAAQQGAFIKGGVELEGSALNVLSETAEKVIEAAQTRRREADFEISQLNVAKHLQRVKGEHAGLQTLLNAGMIGASIFGQTMSEKDVGKTDFDSSDTQTSIRGGSKNQFLRDSI